MFNLQGYLGPWLYGECEVTGHIKGTCKHLYRPPLERSGQLYIFLLCRGDRWHVGNPPSHLEKERKNRGNKVGTMVSIYGSDCWTGYKKQ